MRTEKLGDRMPDRRSVKWGEMKAGESHLSEEWHDMMPSEPRMSEKWVDQKPSSPLMSEKWVDMEASMPKMSEEWVGIETSSRRDPYAMNPSDGNRSQPFKAMSKEKADNKVERKTQHTEMGSTREI